MGLANASKSNHLEEMSTNLLRPIFLGVVKLAVFKFCDLLVYLHSSKQADFVFISHSTFLKILYISTTDLKKNIRFLFQFSV